jgi:tRNA pseudouridine38-40 synthase
MTKPVDLGVDGFSRFRVDFSYDGTDFFGFAKQPELRTVQGELLQALAVIFGDDADDFQMRVAGRTDAGVHALGQVAHIDLRESQLKRIGRSVNLVARLNSLLPRDIRVDSFFVAPAGFDARFSATYRKYRYLIADSESRIDPFLARRSLETPNRLDIKAMNRAAKSLIGLNDFAAFCKPRAGATTIRNLKELKVSRIKDNTGVVQVELMADAFCHNMVRSIVGALLAVGSSKASPEEVQRRLDSRSRVGAFKVVGPEGLTLLEVGYPKDSQLATQAEKARNMRSLEEN